MHHRQKWKIYSTWLNRRRVPHYTNNNIYAPNAPNDVNQQLTLFEDLQNLLAEFAQENIVVAEDFNCALMEIDKKGGNSILKKARVIQEIERLINLYDLSDIWRRRNPDTERFMWRKVSQNSSSARLFPYFK